jgi:nucleotide-binding universal stress UspA family protein
MTKRKAKKASSPFREGESSMFEHILVPLDGSQLAECVLPHVLTVAHGSGARVTLLNVLDQFANLNLIKVSDPLDCAIRKAQAEAYLHETSARLSKAGCK